MSPTTGSSSLAPPHSILVIDDEIELAMLFKEFLEKEDYNVVSFSDPILALEKYRNKYANVFDVNSLLKANNDLVEYADALKKKKVSILGEMGVFFFKNQIQSLIDYEFSLPTEFDTNLYAYTTKRTLIGYLQIKKRN